MITQISMSSVNSDIFFFRLRHLAQSNKQDVTVHSRRRVHSTRRLKSWPPPSALWALFSSQESGSRSGNIFKAKARIFLSSGRRRNSPTTSPSRGADPKEGWARSGNTTTTRVVDPPLCLSRIRRMSITFRKRRIRRLLWRTWIKTIGGARRLGRHRLPTPDGPWWLQPNPRLWMVGCSECSEPDYCFCPCDKKVGVWNGGKGDINMFWRRMKIILCDLVIHIRA